MSDDMGIEKIDLDKVDWRGSRDFFESLGEALDKLDDKDESYDFTWVGKRKSIIEAGAPINKTLRPDVANSKNWDTTENLFIEGDNLDALKLLQESYLGKVKMIYIDPPYNTGKDFVYHDSFAADIDTYKEDVQYEDEEGNKLFDYRKNEKANGRYHSDWLSMMYPRLKLARNLLAEDGVIFISIDDNESHNLRKLCDEIFGESNFIANAVWRSKDNSNNDAKKFSIDHNNTLIYARSPDWQPALISNETKQSHYKNPDNDPNGAYFDGNPLNSPNYRENLVYDLISPSGIVIKPPKNGWRWSEPVMQEKIQSGEIRFTEDQKNIRRRTYLKDAKGLPPSTLWIDLDVTGHNRQAKYELLGLIPEDVFDTPKPIKLIRYILELSQVSSNDIVLDFFAGSATTAHAIMQLNSEDSGNRKWIMVQLPEETDEKSEAYKAGYKTIPDIARERIRRAGDKIATEHPEAKVDYGFRALRIDDTNYKEVYKPAGEQQQSTLLNLVDNIKDDRSELDLLYGVITQSALELNRPLETREIAGSNVFLYDYFGEVSGLVACFGDSIGEETIKEIAKLKPLTVVFRDSTFPDSQAKVNLGEHFRILSAETKVKVI